MASKRLKKEIHKDDLEQKVRPKKVLSLKTNPNSTEQVKILLHLLIRAKSSKLDSLGVCWNDEDLGLGGYADFYDLPAKSLSDMLNQLATTLESC